MIKNMPTLPGAGNVQTMRALFSKTSRTAASPIHQKSSLKAALCEWRKVLDEVDVITGMLANQRCQPNTLAINRSVPTVLRPRTVEQISRIVCIARKYKVALYSVSTGKNWGYGSALPVRKNSVVLDLSQMNAILSFDEELGLVTVQPGVTQGILETYLKEHNLEFLIPVTGAGPNASLLGNALERGYGITPHADHFDALMSLEAVLPNGEMYRSALADAGGKEVDGAFKWGLGPYLDGLFTQGNFGIVTQVTLALVKRPERTEGFFFSLKSDKAFEEAVIAVRQILQTLGGVTGSINLMNTRRILAMTDPYPWEQVPSGGIIPDNTVNSMARRRRLTAWSGVGALYGPAALVKVARKLIKAALKPHVKDMVFLTPEFARFAKRVANKIPLFRNTAIVDTLNRVELTLQHMAGKPGMIAMPLAYWKNRNGMPRDGNLDPARGQCGLIWYSPLVPLKAERARCYVEMVERICRAHSIEPLITLTSLSCLSFDSTVPLLFDRSNSDEVLRAHACYDALYEAGRVEGFLPYRSGVQTMAKMVDSDSSFWKLGASLKRAIDPDGIIAPGRYSL